MVFTRLGLLKVPVPFGVDHNVIFVFVTVASMVVTVSPSQIVRLLPASTSGWFCMVSTISSVTVPAQGATEVAVSVSVTDPKPISPAVGV